MKVLERIIVRIETLCQAVADVFMFAIMLVVVADVLMRYLFNSPIYWVYDLVSLYLMAGVFFLSLSRTYAAHGHIGMDLFVEKLSANGHRVVEIITCVVAIPFFALIIKAGAERAYAHWTNGDAISGLIAWPTWIGASFVPLGVGLLVVRLAFRLTWNVAGLVSGSNVELLPTRADEVAE